MSFATIAAVLGLALLDTLSPALIGVTLYLLLARPRRLGLLLSSYLGTVAASYFAMGCLLMFGLAAVLPAVDESVWQWVQRAVGVILFAASWFVPARDPASRPRRPVAFTVPAVVVFGLGTWLFEVATAVPYFAAVGIMTSNRLAPGQWLPLLAGYVVIMVLPGIVLYAIWRLVGARVRGRFDRWRDRVDRGSGETLSWMMGIAGVLLVLNTLPDQIVIGNG